MSEANKRQVGATHYKTNHGLEHWDLVEMFGWDYFQAQIIRYVMRCHNKNGIEDLEKAAHYIEKYVEVLKARPEAKPYPSQWDPSETIPADRSGS